MNICRERECFLLALLMQLLKKKKSADKLKAHKSFFGFKSLGSFFLYLFILCMCVINGIADPADLLMLFELKF